MSVYSYFYMEADVDLLFVLCIGWYLLPYIRLIIHHKYVETSIL